jgi:hypothetical protein
MTMPMLLGRNDATRAQFLTFLTAGRFLGLPDLYDTTTSMLRDPD